MSYIVPFADKQDNEIFIKRFEARSYTECQEKIIEYVENEWGIDEQFPDNYNKFVELMKDYDLLIGDIKDLDLI